MASDIETLYNTARVDLKYLCLGIKYTTRDVCREIRENLSKTYETTATAVDSCCCKRRNKHESDDEDVLDQIPTEAEKVIEQQPRVHINLPLVLDTTFEASGVFGSEKEITSLVIGSEEDKTSSVSPVDVRSATDIFVEKGKAHTDALPWLEDCFSVGEDDDNDAAMEKEVVDGDEERFDLDLGLSESDTDSNFGDDKGLAIHTAAIPSHAGAQIERAPSTEAPARLFIQYNTSSVYSETESELKYPVPEIGSLEASFIAKSAGCESGIKTNAADSHFSTLSGKTAINTGSGSTSLSTSAVNTAVNSMRAAPLAYQSLLEVVEEPFTRRAPRVLVPVPVETSRAGLKTTIEPKDEDSEQYGSVCIDEPLAEAAKPAAILPEPDVTKVEEGSGLDKEFIRIQNAVETGDMKPPPFPTEEFTGQNAYFVGPDAPRGIYLTALGLYKSDSQSTFGVYGCDGTTRSQEFAGGPSVLVHEADRELASNTNGAAVGLTELCNASDVFVDIDLGPPSYLQQQKKSTALEVCDSAVRRVRSALFGTPTRVGHIQRMKSFSQLREQTDSTVDSTRIMANGIHNYVNSVDGLGSTLNQHVESFTKGISRGLSILRGTRAPLTTSTKDIQEKDQVKDAPETHVVVGLNDSVNPVPSLDIRDEVVSDMPVLSPTPSKASLMRDILDAKVEGINRLRTPQHATGNPNLAVGAMRSGLLSADYTPDITNSDFSWPFQNFNWEAPDGTGRPWYIDENGKHLGSTGRGLGSLPPSILTDPDPSTWKNGILASPVPSMGSVSPCPVRGHSGRQSPSLGPPGLRRTSNHRSSPQLGQSLGLGSISRLRLDPSRSVLSIDAVTKSISGSSVLSDTPGSPLMPSTSMENVSPNTNNTKLGPSRKISPLYVPQPHRTASLSTSGLHITPERGYYMSFDEMLKQTKPWMKNKRSTDF